MRHLYFDLFLLQVNVVLVWFHGENVLLVYTMIG